MILFFILACSTVNALAAEQLPTAGHVVVIDKAQKKLALLKNGIRVAEFSVAFGVDPDSDKVKTWDGATPEGLYVITYKKNDSRFHRFLGISYPNLANAARGLARGVISLKEYKKISRAMQRFGQIPCDTGLGSGIGIHGGGVFRYFGKNLETDWTDGCIALDNQDIEQVFNFCNPGDPVLIFNSRRNLCGIIRPFTYVKDIGENGVPICPEGTCTYQFKMPTFLGTMAFVVMEGKVYGRSLEVKVYENGARKRPLLVLLDRNADGLVSDLDSISGPMAEKKDPETIYAQLREAVVSALSSGLSYASGGQ